MSHRDTAICRDNVSRVNRTLTVTAVALVLACSGCKMAADGQNLQGVRMYEQGQYDGAMQKFQEAVANDPSNADAYYNMAATLHRAGVDRKDENLIQQSETLYNRCLDLNPDHEDCHRGLAVLLVETGRSDRAFNLLKNWAIRSPENADARIELARLYEEFGDPSTAQVQLTEAINIDHDNVRAWNALGRLREQSGDYAQALADYQQAYSLNRFQPEVAERIAALNRSLSQQYGATFATDGTRTVTTAPPMTR